ncbi:HNH endonuclease signature motif containing protein [Streptomyces orinoci]|uniref:HNH endonuclease signature motif containing protein n=1 Tax=Streptomyces orinoci TaxID=67339 RepID=A0ABV3K089_STRON|nr:HNH endonuclease signature motif containing protein [Streptomyces orinoci]
MPWHTSNQAARLPGNWSVIRTHVLSRDPVCRICGVRPSTQIDHIKAMTDDHRDHALQGVRYPCHAQKSAQEGAAGRAQRPGQRRPDDDHPGQLS